MNTKIKLSSIVTLLLATSLSAQTVELQKGWNLIGLTSKPVSSITPSVFKAEDVITYGWKVNAFTGLKSFSVDLAPTTIVAGQAYWIKKSSAENIEIATNALDVVNPTFNPGWNLITFPLNQVKDDLIKNLHQSGTAVDDIITYEWKVNAFTGVKSFSVNLAPTSINSGQGYWLKTKTLALRAKTKDDIYLDFYANDTADSLDKNTTSSAISALTYAQIKAGGLASSNFTTFSGEAVVATQDTHTDVIKELTHNLVMVDSSGISVNSLPASDAVVNNTTTITNVVIYAYSIAAAGAPQILSGATLVKVDADGTEKELGTSDSNGLIVPTEDIRDKKVILRAAGTADMSLSLDSTYNKSSYYAILAAGSTTEIGQTTDTTLSSSSRILGRTTNTLERETSQYQDINKLVVYHMNQVSVKRGTLQKFTITQNIVSDKFNLESKLQEPNYIPTIITALDVSLKDSSTSKTLNPSKTKFSELYLADATHKSNIDEFYIGLTGKDTGYSYDGIDGNSIFNDGNVSDNDPNKKGKLEVWMYKDDTWSKVSSHSKLLKIDALSDSDSVEKSVKKRLKKSDYYIKLTDVGIGSGQEYNGYYPLAVVYKQLNVTQKSFTVTVKDGDTNVAIPNALVRLGAANYVTDANGSVVLSVTVTGDGGLIPLSATEPKHLRAVSSVDPLALSDTLSNDIVLTLSPIPNSATITGTVLDSDTKAGVLNSLVDIVNPISLDQAKITTRDGIKGIEVGLDSAATYTWYIKEAIPETVLTRTLARVSKTSWMTVKEDKAKNGNFISYNEIVKTLLKPALAGESDAISGLFDIAVKIEHDVNGDGKSDYTELAINGTTTVLNNDDNGTSAIGTQVTDAFVKDYAKKIGQLKIALDAEKVAAASTNAEDSGTVIFTTATNKYVQKNHEFEDQNEDNTDEDKYAKFDLAIGGGNVDRAFRINGLSSEYLGANASLEWKTAIIADIVNSNEKVVTSVFLDKNFEWKPLNANHDSFEILALDDIEKGEFLANNTNFVVGSLKYVDGNLVSNDNTISYKRLMRAIADDRLIKALNKTIAQIAIEAGVSTTGVTDTSIKMLKDGISLLLVADINYVRDPQDANESVRAILHTRGLTLKADKVEDLLTITDAPITPLSQIAGTMSTYSDRAGEFRFARVPYDFGKLNENNSLMRLKANRFDYFENSVNVGAFQQLESALTTVQQNVNIKARKSYSVTLDFKDAGGTNDVKLDDIIGTTVVITGSKGNNGDITTNTIGADGNLSLARIIPNTSGFTPTYGDILEGYQSVMVFKPGFKTVEKKFNLRQNEIVKVNWEPVSNPADSADFTAQIDIDYENSIVNYDTGKAVLSGLVYDKGDGANTAYTLSKNAKVSLLVNNQPLNANIVYSDGSKFSVSFDLPKGTSEAKIIVVNDKGIANSPVVYYDYNPDFGSLKGTVGGVKSDEYAIVTIYNSDSEPVANAVPGTDGKYNFISLAVGKYTMSAMAFDASGNGYSSNTVSVEVVGGKIIQADDMTISHVTPALSGAPVVEFTTGDISYPAADIALVATVNNFELGDDVKDRFAIVVNDVAYAVQNSNFTVSSTNNYTFNYTLPLANLHSGQNTVYLVAVNKNGNYDFSADLYITTAQASTINATDVEFVYDTNKTITNDYVYLDLYSSNGSELKGHYLSDTIDSNNFIVLGEIEAGRYIADIYTQNDNYIGLTTYVDVNSSGIYLNNALLPDSDKDGYAEFSLTPHVESIAANTAPTLNLPLNRLDISVDDSAYTMYDIVSDIDGDNLTITFGDFNSSIADVTASGYDLIITPKAAGEIEVPVYINDGTVTVSGSFKVKVLSAEVIVPNSAPTILGENSYNLYEGNNYISIEIKDAEYDSLNVSLSGFDDTVISAYYDGSGLVNIQALANGTTNLTVDVNDGHNGTVSKTFTINVSFASETPTVEIPPSVPGLDTNASLETPPEPSNLVY